MTPFFMDDLFAITITYKNEDLTFPAQLLTSAYAYQIQIDIHEVLVNFERDDSGDFRALAASPDDARFHQIPTALLRAIADKLEEVLS